MKTRVYTVRHLEAAGPAIDECAAILRRGGLVAFPTETVYGLGADALNPRAVRAIFAAKGRPSDNPLIVHFADAEGAFSVADHVSATARTLAKAFWPGPLTLVLPRASHVPHELTGGLETVAVRVPDHPVALALLRAFGGGVAAPSANASGRPSPTRAEHVLEDLAGRIDAVLDGGETGVGVESTVVDARGAVPVILRFGGVPPEAIAAVAGGVECATDGAKEAEGGRPRSPGQKYRHYAPRAPLYIVKGRPDEVQRALTRLMRPGNAFLLSAETAAAIGLGPDDSRCYVLGPRTDLDAIAKRLYDGLRSLDRTRPVAIYAEELGGAGLGRALADRLERAAEGRVIEAARWLAEAEPAGKGSACSDA